MRGKTLMSTLWLCVAEREKSNEYSVAVCSGDGKL